MLELDLYRSMARQRAVEMALGELWHRGLVPGEMHLGTGEEAVVAGVLAHREPGDRFAIDHRPSTVMTEVGVDPRAILAECIGREEGLCGGQGGHMHLYSKEHLAASSGIVGSAGPAAVGFALAAKVQEPGAVAFAFFGDGAANQGMLLESLNLASAWSLPVLFVCKDNGWAIATRTAEVTGGDLRARAQAFGLAADEVDGGDATMVWSAAATLLARVRTGKGPAFLLAHVPRLDGHLLGDPLVRMAKKPLTEGGATTRDLLRGLFGRKGSGLGGRAKSVGHLLGLMASARGAERGNRQDPLVRLAKRLEGHRDEVSAIDEEVLLPVADALRAVAGDDQEEAA
ncbi:MAG: thiamine pyrophosphate-dependent dehydrogenase E1 component subunit alpha [Sandaracinaceae bacterium]